MFLIALNVGYFPDTQREIELVSISRGSYISTPIVSVTPEICKPEKGLVRVKVKSSAKPQAGSWTESWLRMGDTTEGNGKVEGDVYTFVYRIAANSDYNPRSKVFTYTNGDYSANAVISQEAKVRILTVNQVSPYVVDGFGGDVSIIVTSTETPSVSISQNWMTQKSSGVDSNRGIYYYTFHTDFNNSSERTVKITFTNGDLTRNVTITQQKKPDFIKVISIEPSICSCDGGDVTIVVYASNEYPRYSTTDWPDWLTHKRTLKTAENTFTYVFTLAENTSDARSHTVIFRNGTLSANATVNQEENGNPLANYNRWTIDIATDNSWSPDNTTSK